jgi:hypothetical protein
MATREIGSLTATNAQRAGISNRNGKHGLTGWQEFRLKLLRQNGFGR